MALNDVVGLAAVIRLHALTVGYLAHCFRSLGVVLSPSSEDG